MYTRNCTFNSIFLTWFVVTFKEWKYRRLSFWELKKEIRNTIIIWYGTVIVCWFRIFVFLIFSGAVEVNPVMLLSLIYLTWEYLMKRQRKTRMIQGCFTGGCPVPRNVPAERDCCRVLHSRYLEIPRQWQNQG